MIRQFFAQLVHNEMQANDRIVVLTGDLGYKMWDEVRQSYPNRFINVGAAEQSLIGVAVGLAQGGKIPIVYSITPFLLYRPFETIRNYIHHEKIPVKLIGGGRNRDYGYNGYSHWAEEDKELMKILYNISSHWPDTHEQVELVFRRMIETAAPFYLNLNR